MKTLIKNAKLIDGKSVDILIENGIVVRIGNGRNISADVVIDADGKYAVSGCVNAYFDGNIDEASKLLSQGVTTVFDFSNDDKITKYLIDKGIKVFKAIGDFDGETLLNESFLEQQVENNKKLGVVKSILYLKNPNESEGDNFNTVITNASKNNFIVATHVSETLENVGEIDKEFGMSPIGLLENYGFLDRKCLLIDCVYVDKEDVEILNNYDVNIITCPTNNLSDGYGIAPVYSFIKNGLNVLVGGVSSNHFKEIRLVGDLQSGVLNEKSIINISDLKNMNCYNARKIFNEIGGLNEGLSADIVLLNDNNLMNLTPINVKMVFVNGKLVYQQK